MAIEPASDTPRIHDEACTGCADCVDACPSDVLAVLDGKATIVRPEDCDYCADCEPICPAGAIDCGYEISFAEDVPA